MLGLAAPTPYDLRFRLLGIPVRVHPLFWLIMAVLSGGENHLPEVLIFIGCAFLSILVHEYGHGLVSRFYGHPPAEIVLFWMGGYCACDLGRQRPWHRLAVLVAGPGAGFLLLGVLFLVGKVFLGISFADDLELVQTMVGLSSGHNLSMAYFMLSRTVQSIYWVMTVINLMWGLLNLLPILPLDGGRILEVCLTMLNPRQGMRWAHIVSLLTAGSLAMVFFRWNQTGPGIWFAYFAFQNYQVLQALHQTAKYGQVEDDADWWRR
ncbi:site-2 protease family protein [Singulisphaera acidiphila]|uniref:Zn-dependent protease n=1 Tax=Singulisphaera acidiphila (strain ATCC BAA-1392 / DSM 18658 / VKM B-2454 / MOB10) TaxID=886293 RepID=L0DFI9_SINAD|nr:site-2 protease family protein [Singulisphaera acidiphila]AGA27411.1 Zn-dependent protease [Singulisphaera acidiphila DSM 18658]